MIKNLGEWSIDNPLYPWLIVLACLFGGAYGIENVGRLEDPAFPFSTAFIVVPYPGASAEEVEHEVTDVIESAIQQLPSVDLIKSKSLRGRSEVQVDLLEQYSSSELPQIWDELRRRISEAQIRLPPGAGKPIIEDDFADVYGLLYAITTPGYSAANIADISRDLSTAVKLVPGVAKVSSAGESIEAIFVEVNQERLVTLGIPIDVLFGSIARENGVISAGSVAFDSRRLMIAPPIAFDSVEAVENMRIGKPGSTEVFKLSEIASISGGLSKCPRRLSATMAKVLLPLVFQLRQDSMYQKLERRLIGRSHV